MTNFSDRLARAYAELDKQLCAGTTTLLEFEQFVFGGPTTGQPMARRQVGPGQMVCLDPDITKRLPIALRLMAARMSKFATASEAARYLSLQTGTYLAHENGTREITWDQAVVYSGKFGIQESWLMKGKGSPSDNPKKAEAIEANLKTISKSHTAR